MSVATVRKIGAPGPPSSDANAEHYPYSVPEVHAAVTRDNDRTLSRALTRGPRCLRRYVNFPQQRAQTTDVSSSCLNPVPPTHWRAPLHPLPTAAATRRKSAARPRRECAPRLVEDRETRLVRLTAGAPRER